MSEIEIDFSNYISIKDTALVGRDYGKVLLAKVIAVIGPLEQLEAANDRIVIRIPKRIVTMNKSFFLGFFELRVIALGKDVFLSKYVFSAGDYIVNKLRAYADSALLAASMKDILDV